MRTVTLLLLIVNLASAGCQNEPHVPQPQQVRSVQTATGLEEPILESEGP